MPKETQENIPTVKITIEICTVCGRHVRQPHTRETCLFGFGGKALVKKRGMYDTTVVYASTWPPYG